MGVAAPKRWWPKRRWQGGHLKRLQALLKGRDSDGGGDGGCSSLERFFKGGAGGWSSAAAGELQPTVCLHRVVLDAQRGLQHGEVIWRGRDPERDELHRDGGRGEEEGVVGEATLRPGRECHPQRHLSTALEQDSGLREPR